MPLQTAGGYISGAGLLYDIYVFTVLMVEVFFTGEFLKRIALGLELFEFAVHRCDLTLVELDLALLVTQSDTRTDHLPDIVRVEEAYPYHEDEADDEVLVEQYLTDTGLLPGAVFLSDFGKNGHAEDVSTKIMIIFDL